MKTEKLIILILEDDDRLLDELSEYLENIGYLVHKASKPSVASSLIHHHKIDIAIIDIKLPEYNGLEFLKQMKQSDADIEAVMISGHGDIDNVIEALRLGAYDFLQKPFTPMDINIAIERTGKYKQLQKRTASLEVACKNLQSELLSLEGFQLVGVSKSTQDILKLVRAAAEHPDSPVVITGESGTGKELVARLIHLNSSRSMGRFIPVNCAAVPEQLSESEFFGHTKGAFTSSLQARNGYFRMADKGTLFLDEIGDMPYSLQTKLLRVVEGRTVRPVGSDKEIPVDVRILCATNCPIDQLISSNTFRLDLYHRISVIQIHIPPLRERPEDIPVLALYFLETLCAKMGKRRMLPDSNSLELLCSYDFPGNVRELRNIVEKAIIMGSEPIVFTIPTPSTPITTQTDFVGMNFWGEALPSLNIEELEKTAIQFALAKTDNNLSKASLLLGLSRQALDRRMLKYKLIQ